MGISKDKTRYALTLKKETKQQLEAIAKQENRSLNNLIETLIENFLKERA